MTASFNSLERRFHELEAQQRAAQGAVAGTLPDPTAPVKQDD
jgi:hypothetical protein